MPLLLSALVRSVELLTTAEELEALAPDVINNSLASDLGEQGAELATSVEGLLDFAIERAGSTTEPTTAEQVENLLRLAHALVQLFVIARNIASTAGLDTKQARRLLVDVPLLRALARDAPRSGAVLDLMGLVEIKRDDQGVIAADSAINWDSLGDFLTDPLAVARAGWTKSDGSVDLAAFSRKLHAVLHSVGSDVALRRSTLEHEMPLISKGNDVGRELQPSGLVLETTLISNPATGLALKGQIIPFHEVSSHSVSIGAVFWIDGEILIPLGGGYEVFARTNGPPLAEAGLLFLPGPQIETTGGLAGGADFGVEFGARRTDSTEAISLYRDDQFQIAVQGVEVKSGLSRVDGSLEFLLETTVKGLSFGAATGKSDGFVKKVADQGMGATFDLTVGWSTLQGIYFRGSGQLELTIPIHQSVGPLDIESLYLAIAFASNVDVTLAVSFGAKLGPVAVSVDRIGLTLPVELGGDPPVQLSMPSFKAPRGAGLAIDAGAVKGGGFIRHDEERSSYDGILDLKIGDIGLVAVAIITTKQDNFALFINIGVTFSPPITLPYNFNLQGCGGLCAVNRTMDTEALRSGLRNKTLDSILFPENPILNANKIISDSERVFPIEEGRYVFGPMAKLGWGAKGLITANIAIVIEFPAPIVIALLGQLKARVPQSEDAKVKINLDVLGVLEIEKKSLSFDASLYDSKILVYDLSGDSAMRLRWGNSPVFALSVGGFHPRFTPPANFPSLKRLTLALSSGSSFELSCTVYHALTSNTLQFGARLRLHAEACGAELNGHLSFDTLFQFSPFEFEVGISGGVGASYKGHNIASVHVSCDLSGPNPWHAKGKAKVSVLCWDVTARFHKTWGNDNKVSVAKIDPLPYFVEEINLVGNWASALSRRSIVETLKSLDAPVPSAEQADAAPAETVDDPNKPDLLVHPAGSLEFRQRLLPLATRLEQFKNADVDTNDKFDVRIELGPETPPTASTDPCVSTMGAATEVEVKEHFARGQFKSLSKADRLSKPSFERFRAGAQVGPDTVRLDGCVQECELEYESILILSDGARERENAKAAAWAFMKRALKAAALRRASLRHQRLGRFGTGKPARVTLKDEAYSVVYQTSLRRVESVYPPGAPALNQTQAEDLIRAAIADQLAAAGSIIAVPEYEEVE